MSHPSEDGYCPNCGAEVPSGSLACPDCGSCEETGWSRDASYDRIGVEVEDNFDYQRFVDENLSGKTSQPKSALQWVWMIVALLLLLLILKGMRL